MPKRDAARKRAREIQDTEGIGYHDALNRARAEAAAAEPATTEEAPAPAPAAVAYVLEPTAAEAELGITAEELGVRALPAEATPEQRAHAEAVWRPTEAEQPCRCSGPKCYHGAPCGIEYVDEGPCPGPMQHVDRHPGSMFSLTAWYDVYRCTDCGETYETTVELPELPWGAVRNRDELDGTERTLSDGLGGPTVTVIYQGIRHPNFPDHDPEEGDEEELDPDNYPTPEDDYDRYDDEDQEHEEPLAEEGQEDEPDYLDDDPGPDDYADPIGAPPEDYDGPDENELGPPSLVPAVDHDPQPTAADWSLMEPRSW
ncbi:hypothetical protein [Streptomyces marianii]|uniref:Uncharacterized protein n=1 Tax=Streptomyces marianii TaxID=1817406 RepID=A0A5R9DS82_9ACTN|nr:hypothetical protein [Streptomyces marianii]TLQ38827.1 hypothetical protein FEF34_40140 [Streptomyces marianii]